MLFIYIYRFQREIERADGDVGMEVGQPYDYFSSAQPYFCDFPHLIPDEHRAAVYLPAGSLSGRGWSCRGLAQNEHTGSPFGDGYT